MQQNVEEDILLRSLSLSIIKQLCRYVEVGCLRILELPLLETSSKMETALIAGKTWQPSHEPPRPQEDTRTCHIDTQWKAEGGNGSKQKPLKAPKIMLLLPTTLINKCYRPKQVPRMCKYAKTTDNHCLRSLLVALLVKLCLSSCSNTCLDTMCLWGLWCVACKECLSVSCEINFNCWCFCELA